MCLYMSPGHRKGGVSGSDEPERKIDRGNQCRFSLAWTRFTGQPLVRAFRKRGQWGSRCFKSLVPSPFTVHAGNQVWKSTPSRVAVTDQAERQVRRDASGLARHREVVAAERGSGRRRGGGEKENAKNKMWSNSPGATARTGEKWSRPSRRSDIQRGAQL